MILFELFYVFFYIGLFTFGGGYAMIPMIQEEIVSRGWIDSSSLTDFIAISESTPGPFAINIATFVGSQTAGFFGSIMATLGVVLPSFIVIIIVACILDKFIKNRFVKGAIKGAKPIVISLILSTAIFFLLKVLFAQGNSFNIHTKQYSFDRCAFTLLIILSGVCVIYKIKHKKSLHPIALLGLSAIAGIIIYFICGY